MKRVLIAFVLLFTAVLTASAFKPYVVPDLEPRPDFWKVRTAEIIKLCKSVKKGHSEVIARTPGGFPVYAVFYGDFSEPAPQTNWSAGNSSSTIKAYLGDHKPTLLFLAGVHGSEPENVAAAVNMIQLLETGKDFRGKTDEEFLSLSEKYRIIIIPCANMDGRSLCPDHLRGQPYKVFRAVCQGVWKTGELVGWKGSKMYFPLPLDKVSFPGGYPNADGYNIQHDVAPGDMRTKEAQAICKLVARWRVDYVLNGHSCEYQPFVREPSEIESFKNAEKGIRLSKLINDALYEAGLRTTPRPEKKRPETYNLTNLMGWCSGAVSLTLECSSSYDDINKPTVCYTFDQLMEPAFVALKVMMREGRIPCNR